MTSFTIALAHGMLPISDSAPKQGREGEWRLTDSFSSLSFMDIPWGKEVYLPSRWVRTACETKGSP